MRYIRHFAMILLASWFVSCAGQKYYRKVTKNIGSFDNAISNIRQHGYFSKTDVVPIGEGKVADLNKVCIYPEDIKDPALSNFMREYQLKRICFSRRKDQYFDSVITFHKDFSPMFGKAVVVTYDFGKSGLRELTNKGGKLKDEEVKIINDFYLYRVRARPAFGE